MISWIRRQKLNYNLKKANKELEISKQNLTNEIDESITKMQNGIVQVSEILIDFKKYKYNKHDSFFNLCIFSDIVNIDLTILLEKFRLAQREEERKLFARVLSVVLVDYFENLSVLIGRDCLKELNSNNMTEFIPEFKSLHKKFSDFRKSNEKKLRDLRNNTIAHKCNDALKLHKQIESIDSENIYKLGVELKEYSTEFINLSTKVIYYIVDYMNEGRKI